jgi:cytochrome c
MPWTAPKSLTADEVYSVTAFLMNLAEVVPDDFLLSDKNIAEVQKRLPNRNGMTTQHAMWPDKAMNGVDGLIAKPDTQGSSCIKNCPVTTKVVSVIPAYAMNAHGNLADQNRTWTSVVGLDTSKPMTESEVFTSVRTEPVEVSSNSLRQTQAERIGIKLTSKEIMPLLQKNACTACHAVAAKVMGPAFNDVAKKYAGRSDVALYLMGKIKTGGSGVWGSIPMPPMNISDAESKKIAQWLSQGISQGNL